MFQKLKDGIILVLSVFVVVQLSLEIIHTIPPEHQLLLDHLDLYICLIFLFDFFYELYFSKNKKQYLKSNWVDFISSIPYVSFLRFLRIARIVRLVRLMRLLRLLRGVKGFTAIARIVTKNKLRSILVIYSTILVFVVFYCSLGFYMVEKQVNENVKSFADAIWWAFITVTSVGYGDIFPKTFEGRIFAIVLTLCGMGMFSLITAELSSKFITYMKNEENKTP